MVTTGSETVKRVAVFLLERAKTNLAKPNQTNFNTQYEIDLVYGKEGDDQTTLSLTSTL